MPLSTFASMRYEVQPQALNHFQQLNAATITLVPKPGVTQGQALDFLQRQGARRSSPRATAWITAASRGSSSRRAARFLVAFAFGAIIIFLVLAAQFESFRDPLIILLGSVPMTLSGGAGFHLPRVPRRS